MYFETIKAVLDTTLHQLCLRRGIKLKDGHALLERHLRTMSEQWFSGEAPNIAYEDPFCRLAYLYCHVACNANICEMAIRQSPEIVDLIDDKRRAEDELRICAFGGGPGTELLAVCKHLLKRQISAPPLEISFTLLDRVAEWAESWRGLQREINAAIKARFPKAKDRPFRRADCSVLPFDMTRVDSYANVDSMLAHDLYVMNYVISEVLENEDALQEVLTRMITAAPRGAFVLVVDRDQTAVRRRALALLRKAGLSTGDVGTYSGNMDNDEQASDLEPYVSQIGRRPRVQMNSGGKGVFWIVGTKP